MKKNILFVLALTAIALQCCAITEQQSEPTPTISDIDRFVDSIYNAMSDDERLMQLYLYAPKTSDNFIVQSGPVPGGVLLPVSTFATMQKQIDALGSWGDVPGLVALNLNRPIPATPNYMNPYNVAASRHDSLVTHIVTTTLTDTLSAMGFEATTGFIANKFGLREKIQHSRRIAILNDTTTITAFSLTTDASVKTAIESDNLLIVGSSSPEIFLVRAQTAAKEHPEIDSTIGQKVRQILKMKYLLPSKHHRTPCDIPASEASAICALKAITCINNDAKILPLPSGSNIEIIQIGGLKISAFGTQAGIYGDYSYKYTDTSTASVTATLNKRNKNRRSVILLNALITNPATASAIKKATADGKTCVINFDNSKNLTFIDGKCIVQQVGNNATAAQMAARAVFGEIDINGAFPYKEVGTAKRGEGIKIAANKLKYCLLRETDFNIAYKDTLDSIISAAIRDGAFPGCQVFAAKDGKILINKAYGNLTYDDKQRHVNTADLYDIASLTKVSATTMMTMYLYDQKLMDTDKPLGTYLHYDDTLPKPIMNVKLKSILEHRSGIYAYPPIIRYVNNSIGWKRLGSTIGLDTDTLPPAKLAETAYNEIYRPKFDKDSATTRIADSLWLRDNYRDSLRKFYMHLSVKKRQKYQYSDVNMILLQWANEEVAECRADTFLRRTFYQPLGMTRTFYTPLQYGIPADQIAPTEAQQWTGKMLQGDVHDPAAALLGGISGNAGLFSTAYNIGILFQMMLNGGTYGGHRYLSKKTIDKFTAKQPNTSRGLGFDMAPNNFVATTASKRTYGHTGFTGTCAWADPDNNIIVVFMCNRVHPDAENKKISTLRVRQKISQAIYDGCGIKEDK